MDMNVLQNALSKKFIAKLLKVISFFANQQSDLQEGEEGQSSSSITLSCLERIIECISRVCDYAVQREAVDLENCAAEKSAYFQQQLVYARSVQAQQHLKQPVHLIGE